MSDVTIRKPQERACLRCDRRESWDEQTGSWRIASEDGQKLVGRVFCIHEWDINGSFEPILE